MNKRRRFYLTSLMFVLSIQLMIGQDVKRLSLCPIVKLEVEQLPDLNIPVQVIRCFMKEASCSFAQYVNNYRIEHAKRLLRQKAGQKIANVCFESGFAYETTFFRTFKSIAGMTPKEWLSK